MKWFTGIDVGNSLSPSAKAAVTIPKEISMNGNTDAGYRGRRNFHMGRMVVVRKAVCYFILLHFCFNCSCNRSSATGPGGTDFPNTRTVAGRIIHGDGTAGSFTALRLIAGDFIPTGDTIADGASAGSGSTDSNGYYAITVTDSGMYNLQAIHLQKRTRLLLRGIEVRGPPDDTIHVGENTLTAPGAIAIALPDSLDARSGYVYLRGTGYGVPVDGTAKTVVMDSLPAGVVPSLYFAESGDYGSHTLLQDSTEVSPGVTTLIAPQNGRHSLQLFLNTTSDGADVSENVYQFPLAVRFSELPVEMGEFSADGSDLRITRDDNTPLSFEIEQWDPGRGEALVWVKVDTIFGNNRTQSIYLFWGRANNASAPAAGTVFDTANGFSAVWHLAGGCDDATINNHDGVRQGAVADTAGILGGAQRFHGNDHITIEGLLDTPSTVTLSAWALLDTPDATGSEVVSIGDAVVIRMDDGWSNKGCQASYFSSPGAPDTATHDYLGSAKFLAKTGWHYFAYVFNEATMEHLFYIDGELCCRKNVTALIHYDSIGDNTKIGTHGNGKLYRDFTGSIDEVRVAHTAHAASWIKLCYMNQRGDNRLVFVKKE